MLDPGSIPGISTKNSTDTPCVWLADFLLMVLSPSRLPAEAHEVSAGGASPPLFV